jgi:hypothetical protein
VAVSSVIPVLTVFVAFVALVALVTAVVPIAETICAAEAAENALVPLPNATPLSVATPVPPAVTGKVPVVNTLVDVAYIAPPEVNDVKFVPPLAVGSWPDT